VQPQRGENYSAIESIEIAPARLSVAF